MYKIHILLKQKKQPVLNTSLFFHMSTQVKAEVHSSKALTWVWMQEKETRYFQ